MINHPNRSKRKRETEALPSVPMTPITDEVLAHALRKHVLANPSLGSNREKAAALYGAIAALAFTGRVDESRLMAEACKVHLPLD